jgi:CheY-like chemotaxis protein/predicted regulator of Ras-like GTPase activity (Roadblock/LC7/MglB family)
MAQKRVLIVDDDKAISLMLQRTLKTLGPEYEIFAVGDTVSAINLIEKESFDLILTDYMMPGMTGVDLAMAVRRISPNTQVVMMTAYGTSRLRDTSRYLGIDGVLDKPFELDSIREIVKRAAERASKEAKPTALEQRLKQPQVSELLHNLQANAGVRCVLLITTDGYPVQVVGQTDGFEVSGVSRLVAANFLASAELANLLGKETIFKSSYHEGNNYNIYAHDVNGQLLLALVFEAKQKPGSVWFYTKQAATILARLLCQPASS